MRVVRGPAAFDAPSRDSRLKGGSKRPKESGGWVRAGEGW